MSATGYRAAFRLVGAPAIWILQFSVLYGPKAFVCSRNLAEHYPGFAGVMSAVAACAILAIMLAPLRSTQGDRLFFNRASLAIGALSLCAVVWTSLPVLLLPACAGPG